MRLSQGLWSSNAENADEVVWFVHTDRFQGFHTYDHYLQFRIEQRSLLRWHKTADRFWENKKEMAALLQGCIEYILNFTLCAGKTTYSLTLQM